jgi:parallel beta-helix repeat protein
MHVYGSTGTQLRNNTCYGNGDSELYLYDTTNSIVKNNILWATRGIALYCDSSQLDTGLQCDYNDLYATEGGRLARARYTDYPTLEAWQTATGLDTHSVTLDPRFVDPAGPDGVLGGGGMADDDLHLQSTLGSYHGGAWTADAADSPCLDLGDPADEATQEPAPNGGRINLGAYGNTPQASMSVGERTCC